MKLSQAIKILSFLKQDNLIDANIHDLFLKSRIFYDYAKREMISEQIDEFEETISLE
jgi:hypothetical protein